MLSKLYRQFVSFIINLSLKHPYTITICTLLITIPSLFFINDITVDTNLLKLLPTENPVYKSTMELQKKTGDGGHFIVLFEGASPTILKNAVEYSAKKISQIIGVKEVQYKYPTDYIKKYKYFLIPNDYLNVLYDKVIEIEAKVNPLSDFLIAEDTTAPKTRGQVENYQDLTTQVRLYMNLPEYHQSNDGKYFGILVPTKDGISSLGKIKEIYNQISEINKETESKFNIKTNIAGNHKNKLMDYDTIMHDVSLASIIGVVLILSLLLYSFRRIGTIIIILYPLILGLIWSFAIVPFTFGSLNLITSFLTIILFGLGIDYPIHIVKRLQIELKNKPIKEALITSFEDTGISVIISALTTAAGFIIVIFSNFRGFYEFGILSALSIFMILLAMYIAYPAALVILLKFNGLRKIRPISQRAFIPGPIVSIIFVIITIAGLYFTANELKFDYYLSNTDFQRKNYQNYQEINKKVAQVYSISMSPAAIYAAPSISSMDSTLSILKKAQLDKNTEINRVRSIRDFAPDSIDFNERVELITDIKEILNGDWTNKVSDTNLIKIINDFKSWQMPLDCPKIDEIPSIISDNLLGNKGSGCFLVTVYPKHERKDGKVAIAFSAELDSIQKLPSVKGPVGETIIFADILNLVIGEAWWIVVFGQLLVFLVVLLFQKKFKVSLLMFIPLISGLLITFGIYGIFDIKITFFSVICIPVVMGMGIDGGIHYINRWLVRNKDTLQTQKELSAPLSSAFVTVIFGYCGMILSSHSGLQSIGLLSSLSMLIIWISNLVFLPSILKMYMKFKNKKKE